MKINWGTGIVIVIAVFLIGMISLVVISSMQSINLVSPDYYPQAIDYQKQIDKKKRTKELDQSIHFSQDTQFIYLEFPKLDSLNNPQGEVLLFFPKNYRLDRWYSITTNDSLHQLIAKDSLVKGRCIVKVDWTHNGSEYYQEESIMIN